MKKYFIMAVIASMLTLSLTACGGTGSSDSGSGSSESNSDSGSESNSDSGSDSNSDSGSESNSDSTSESDAQTETATGTFDGGMFGGLEPDTSTKAGRMAKAAIDAAEWPDMMPVTEAEFAQTFFGLDISQCDEFFLANQLMSVNLAEIIIVKPSEGSEDAVKEVLDTHFTYIKNDAAFYPDQEAPAEGAVMGTTDDGYIYIIVHENGSDIASTVLETE